MLQYQRAMYNFHIQSSCFVVPPRKYLNSTAACATDILVKSHHKNKKITSLPGISDGKIQGERKVFPWLQTFITRKLRGIQTGAHVEMY